ncbi:MAG: DUF296 domain-containing protein [Candidatus Omnitrophica bacterium]|nr:DUF296 domain-containing protein [Candidatus Omnitrophota bacterium]
MEYTTARLGRIFLLKFSDKDILVDELERFARRRHLKAAVLLFLGALRTGSLVTGPKKPRIPPEPNWKTFKDGWEVMGAGTVFSGTKGPAVHIHAAMGKKNSALVGCVRKETSVFLVIEAVVFELKGCRAGKSLDPATGLNLLKIYSGHA